MTGPGRPAWQPSPSQRRKAKSLARLGISTREIASLFAVDRKTARKALGSDITAARLGVKTRLSRPVLAEALICPDGNEANDILRRLEAAEKADAATTEGETTQSEPIGDQK